MKPRQKKLLIVAICFALVAILAITLFTVVGKDQGDLTSDVYYREKYTEVNQRDDCIAEWSKHNPAASAVPPPCPGVAQ